MDNILGELALIRYQTAMESAGTMQELTQQQKAGLAERQALRELKKTADRVLNSSVDPNTKELTTAELRELKAQGEAHGVNTAELDDLIRISEANGGHMWVNSDTDWGSKRQELFNKFKEQIDETIQAKSDQDDQLSFQLQILFNKYSTALGQASSTVQQDKQNA